MSELPEFHAQLTENRTGMDRGDSDRMAVEGDAMIATAKKTRTKSMTAAEFVKRYGHESGVELVRGKLVRLPMPGFEHGTLATRAMVLLSVYVDLHQLGRVAGNDTFVRVRRNPDSFRGSDALFISYERLPKNAKKPKGPLEVAPELVVEVRSPNDRMKALREKIEDYLAGGVTAVMVIDPESESIAVFRDDELPMRFHNGDKVVLPDVLPGFSVPAKAFFE
jgi:Uma2 family endonuclease